MAPKQLLLLAASVVAAQHAPAYRTAVDVGTRDDKDILQWLQDNVVDGVYINFPR